MKDRDRERVRRGMQYNHCTGTSDTRTKYAERLELQNIKLKAEAFNRIRSTL